MKTKIIAVTLMAEDVAAAIQFYREVIGLKPVRQSLEPHFDLDGTYLFIAEGKPTACQTQFPVLSFSVPDLEFFVGRLQERNVALPSGIKGDAHARWIRFSDPAGNQIEAVQFA